MLNCLYGDMNYKDGLGSIMSRLSYPSPGFLSSGGWPTIPKKHSTGLINTLIIDFVLNYLFLSLFIYIAVQPRQISSELNTSFDLLLANIKMGK